MRVGIIGLGSIGKRHGTNAEALGHDVAYCDVRAETLAHFADVADMLGYFAPDAVMICTPANTHSQIARELRDLGWAGPTFVEKPLALSVEECAIFREWPHVTTMVGYNLRFHPKIQRWKTAKWKPRGGSFHCCCDVSQWPGSGYGPCVFECSHELDLALWFGAASDPNSSWADGDEAEFEWVDQGREGRLYGWHVYVNGAAKEYLRHWQIKGGGGRIKKKEWKSPIKLGDEMYRAELAHFLECAENNTPTITPFADGIRVVQICETALKMAGAEA